MSTLESKPLATILFLTFNQQDFVEQAARSCLDQTGGPFEIIFSDDCSTDNTYELMKKVVSCYTGPHRVIVRQNSTNLGISGHYNTLVRVAQSELLVTAAGDDISYPHRAQTLLKEWLISGSKLDLISSYARSITFEGNATGELVKVDQLSKWKSAADWCAKRPYVVGATHAFTKRIWTNFGDISVDIPYEDQVVTLRAMCLGHGTTITEPLLDYRMGGVSSKDTGARNHSQKSHIIKRYTRQRSVFLQVRDDLVHVGKQHLWRGKVKKYFNRAQAALWMIENKLTWQETRQIIKFFVTCGFLWTIRQIYISKLKIQ